MLRFITIQGLSRLMGAMMVGLLAGMPWVALLAAGVGAAAPVSAQVMWTDDEDDAAEDGDDAEPRNMADRIGGRELSPSSIERLTRILSLNAEQKAAVADLLAAYQAKRTEASRKMSDFEKALREKHGGGYETGNQAYIKESQDAYKKYGDHQKKLRENVVADIKAVLNDEQSDKWENVERWLRRGRQMARTFGMSGAGRIDLTAMIERLYKGAAIPEGIAQALDAYEGDLDRLLKEQEEYQNKLEEEFMKKRDELEKQPAEEQMALQQTVMLKMMEHSKALREANVRQMKKLLPMIEREEKRAEFEAEFYKKAAASPYSGFMGRGQTGGFDKCLAAAEKLDDLTPAQKRSLEEIRKSIRAERLAMDQKALDEAAKKEDEIVAAGKIDFMTFGLSMANAGKERGEWEQKKLALVKDVLTPEQLEKMPPPLKPVETPKMEFEE